MFSVDSLNDDQLFVWSLYKPTPTPLRPPPCADIITEETEFPPPEGGEYENHPITRDDVIREHDESLINDFPEEGLTQRYSAHYRELHKNQEPAYVPSGISQKVRLYSETVTLL